MARISTYEFDTNITVNDILIGTDGDPSMGLATKNFSVGDLAAWIVSQIDTGGLSLYTHPNHTGQVDSIGDTITSLNITAVTAQDPAPNFTSSDEFIVGHSSNYLYRGSVGQLQQYMQNNLTFNGGAASVLHRTITTSFTINNTDDGYTIFCKSAVPITITIDGSLANGFECDLYNEGVGVVTFLESAVTLTSGTERKLEQYSVATVIKKNDNTYPATILKGELIA